MMNLHKQTRCRSFVGVSGVELLAIMKWMFESRRLFLTWYIDRLTLLACIFVAFAKRKNAAFYQAS